MTEPWFQVDNVRNTVTLTMHAQPAAKRNEIVGVHGDTLKIRIAARPTEGRANAALIAFVAEAFSVPVSKVRLLRGQSARHKVVEITGSARHPASLLTSEDR